MKTIRIPVSSSVLFGEVESALDIARTKQVVEPGEALMFANGIELVYEPRECEPPPLHEARVVGELYEIRGRFYRLRGMTLREVVFADKEPS